MSIKRGKQVSYRPKDRDYPSGGGGPFGQKPPEPELTWAEHMAKNEGAAFTPYAVTSKYQKGALIEHAKFGKGVVTQVEGTKIEVCFESGHKKLSMSA